MQSLHRTTGLSQKVSRRARVANTFLIVCAAGCGSHTASTTGKAAAPTYFAPFVAGTNESGAALPPQTFSIDDTADTFSQTTYALNPPAQEGPQVINAGVVSMGPRGLRSLGITANYTQGGGTGPYLPVIYPSPEMGSFAVELAGQAGGLVQMVGQPAAPLVAATQCPSFTSAQTYQFITIPGPLAQPGNSGTQFTWDPTAETAYGSFDIMTSGSTVSLANIHQQLLPARAGTGAPAQPPAASAAATCAPTFFGDTITVPGQLIVTAPGNNQSAPPQASIGIGPTGLLVEDNGAATASSPLQGTSPALYYNNVLGAGTGAVGLPRSSSALDTGALTGAQYLGFIYAAGTYVPDSSTPAAFSSHLASFGFTSVPSSCAGVAASTSTLIYGGDFTNDDPSTGSGGFGNCDFAVDLGSQDATNPGLYANSTVWIGAAYAGNTTGATYSFPAVAIAGQLGGKYAIFLLGVDSTQPWIVYLLQSN